MWSFCSQVCVCAKTDQAAKVESKPISAQVALSDCVKGADPPVVNEDAKPGNRKRLTVTAATDAGGVNTALPVEDPQAYVEAKGQTEDLEGPTLPAPRDLINSVPSHKEIFSLMKEGHICAVGSTIPATNRVRNAFIEPDFEEKKLEVYGANDVAALRSLLQNTGICIHCKKGRKPEQPNQDNILFCKMDNFTICGVADGHGPDGHWASHWTARFMLKLLLDQVTALGRAPNDATLARIFDITHQAVKMRSEDDRFDLSMSGSTLSICIIDHSAKTVVSAWVGDSRCGLGRPGGVKGEPLTVDHKPQDPQEKTRIQSSGGEVVRLESDVPHRVFVKGGEVPGLAMSRAIGDLIAHRVGVIHLPGISRATLEDHFVLCCSDGVWEFIECDEAGQMVSKVGRSQVMKAGEMLALESRKRWLQEEQTITDDITVICIYL